MGFLKEFRDFAVKGSVIDLAVGVVIGGAFGKITSSLVNDILMPPIGMFLGKVDFSNLYINLTTTPSANLADAKAKGLATVNYGLFFNTVLDFAIVAFAIFLLVRQVNRFRHVQASTPPEDVLLLREIRDLLKKTDAPRP